MRKLLATIGFLMSLNVHAVTFATDASDLWYTPGETGWGLNVIHQGNILFASLFVYGQNTQPSWFFGSELTFASSTGGVLRYSGTWYQTTGPYFGGAFNSSAVGIRQVGTASLAFDTVSTGTLTYSVDGVSVTKKIARLTWVVNNIAGSYLGGTTGTYSSCASSVNNGYAEDAGVVAVTHTGNNVSIVFALTGATCTFSGTYSQDGRMGSVAGTYSCTNGIIGNFNAFEVEANVTGLTARVVAQSNVCRWNGRVGGLRRGG